MLSTLISHFIKFLTFISTLIYKSHLKKLALEVVLSFNRDWQLVTHRASKHQKLLKSLKIRHRKLQKLLPKESDVVEKYRHPGWDDFFDKNDFWSRKHYHISDLPIEVVLPQEEKHRFFSLWFDSGTTGLYWKNEDVFQRAIKELRNTNTFSVTPIPRSSQEGYPVTAPCILDFRFRNKDLKNIHLHSISAETVAIWKIGAGSGYGLDSLTPTPLNIQISRTKKISKVQLAVAGDPDDILRITTQFDIPEGYGDGESAFLVRLSCEYNDNRTLLIGYFDFSPF